MVVRDVTTGTKKYNHIRQQIDTTCAIRYLDTFTRKNNGSMMYEEAKSVIRAKDSTRRIMKH